MHSGEPKDHGVYARHDTGALFDFRTILEPDIRWTNEEA